MKPIKVAQFKFNSKKLIVLHVTILSKTYWEKVPLAQGVKLKICRHNLIKGMRLLYLYNTNKTKVTTLKFAGGT